MPPKRTLTENAPLPARCVIADTVKLQDFEIVFWELATVLPLRFMTTVTWPLAQPWARLTPAGSCSFPRIVLRTRLWARLTLETPASLPAVVAVVVPA